MQGENLGSTEEGDIFTVKGTVNFIKHDGDKVCAV